MSYILEGTISELTAKGNDYLFKITGTEGFAIKQGDKTYNIFRPERIELGNDTFASAFIAPETLEMEAKNFQVALASSAMAGGKRIRIEVDNAGIEIITEANNIQQGGCLYQLQLKSKPLPISSITLLAH